MRYGLIGGWLPTVTPFRIGAHVVPIYDHDTPPMTVGGYTQDGKVVCLTPDRQAIIVSPEWLEYVH